MSYKNGLTEKAKKEYSKALFKFGFYFCILHDKSFRLVSLTEIRKKLTQLSDSRTINRQILNYFEIALKYRTEGIYESGFGKLRLKTRYYYLSLLKKGKTHKPMNYEEILNFFDKYFRGLKFLIRSLKNLEIELNKSF